MASNMETLYWSLMDQGTYEYDCELRAQVYDAIIDLFDRKVISDSELVFLLREIRATDKFSRTSREVVGGLTDLVGTFRGAIAADPLGAWEGRPK